MELLITFFVVVLFISVAFRKRGKSKSRRYKKKSQPYYSREDIEIAQESTDTEASSALTEWEIVSNANFGIQQIINGDEIKVYNALLKKLVYDFPKEYRIFPQVGLGEILTSKDKLAYWKINVKRPDFCITDQNYLPIAVVEYHGGGHYKGNYKERDEIKKMATEKAGLIYHAITYNFLNDLELHIENTLIPQLREKQMSKN